MICCAHLKALSHSDQDSVSCACPGENLNRSACTVSVYPVKLCRLGTIEKNVTDPTYLFMSTTECKEQGGVGGSERKKCACVYIK